jgi:hypothetical protein
MQSSQTMTIAPQPAGWTQTLTFTPFDPSLGTLVGTELIYSDALTGNVSLMNLDASAVTEGVTLTGTDTISVNGVSFGSVAPVATASAPVSAGGFVSLSPSDQSTYNFNVAAAAGQPVAVTVSDQVATSLTGGGNLLAATSASDGATVSLVYSYLPAGSAGSSDGSYFGDVVTPIGPFLVGSLSPANTPNQVFTVADATTGWTQTLKVAQFDPSLGTLNTVNVTIIGDVRARATVENVSDTATTITTTQSANIGIGAPDGYQQSTAKPTVTTTAPVGPRAGASNFDTGVQTATATTSFQLGSAKDLAAFTGTGTIAVPLSATGSGAVSGGSALLAMLAETAGATVEISYGYTPTTQTTSTAFVAAPSIACFASGTRIATSNGPVAVERLAIGDRVRAWFAGEAEIVWIGYRRIDCTRHPNPRAVWPVRVRAGAFGEGRPERDLMLSPDHAVFTDGVLIPVRYLIDGDAVAQVAAPHVEYWHVELARHDVLFAEGLPAESYLAAGNRHAFANGGSKIDLYPDFAPRVWEAEGCAPLTVTGPIVAAARARAAAAAVSAAAVPPAPCTRASPARRPSPTGRPGRIPARG